MNRRNVLNLSVIATCGIIMLPSSALSQQRMLKDQLVGTWNVVSWERSAPDGTKVHTFGTSPQGINFFGDNGRFFVFFARSDLPKLASNIRAKATPQEAMALYQGTIAYHGTYTIDDAAKAINLRIEVTTFPNQAREQKRMIVSIADNDLTYTNPAATAGGQIRISLKRAIEATVGGPAR